MRLNGDNIIAEDGMTFNQLAKSFENEFNRFEVDCKSDGEFGVQLKGMQTFKLTKEDALYILGYTAYSAKWINPYIQNERSMAKNSDAELFIMHLDHALKKVKSTQELILFRMDHAERQDAFIEYRSKKNSIICIDYYLSTDKEEYPECEIIWRIKPLPNGKSKGKDITTITNNGAEKEVLFERESKFRIDEVINSSKLYIDMTEIE